MSLVLSHTSALEYWQSMRVDTQCSKSISRARNLIARPPSIHGVMPEKLKILAKPLDVLVSDVSYRRHSKTLRSHVWSGPLPKGSILDTGQGFYVCSPELCFVQMAGLLQIAQTIKLGFECCGTYDTGQKNNEVYASLPLTKVSRLATFLTRLNTSRGTKKAKRALPHIADGAASPMESNLTMLLCLPYGLGGYGLPRPMLNYRIENVKDGRSSISKQFYVCDLFWPDEYLAVEYDSDMFHTGADRIASDSMRRTDLAVLGITVISATRKQLMNVIETEKLAQLLAKHLGKRIRYEEPTFTLARTELRKLLFNFHA